MQNIGVSKGCPVAPRDQTTVYTRTLHRACEVLGGVPQLASRLNVPPPALQRWLDGHAEPPLAVFLACVDIALDHEIERIRRDKPS